MRRLAMLLLAILAPLLGPTPARADDTVCAGELHSLIVLGNLVVPDGGACGLRDAVVQGDVLVGRNAGLRLHGAIAIHGTLLADHCDYVSLDPTAPGHAIAVGGSVEIRRCAETSGKLFTAGRVLIAGNFICHDNLAPCFAVSMVIGGHALIRRNAGGASYIEGNVIGGDLRCLGNSGVTDYGSPNTVGGDKLGQCARLS